MKQETAICRRLKEEGVDSAMVAQYQRYEEAGNIRGQYGLVCRFRRAKNEELKEDREKLACLDYLIAQLEHADFMQETASTGGKEGR